MLVFVLFGIWVVFLVWLDIPCARARAATGEIKRR